MPILHINKILPADEEFIITIDDNIVNEEIISVPKEFRLKIIQNRMAINRHLSIKTFLKIILAAIFGGRISMGNEIAYPYHASWEGECILTRDGEINIALLKSGHHAEFEVNSETVTMKTNDKGEKSSISEKIIWTIVILIFGIPFTLIAGSGLLAVISSYLNYPENTPIWAVIIFVVLFGSAIAYVWIMAIIRLKTKPSNGRLKRDSEKTRKRMDRITRYLKVTTWVHLSAAVLEILGAFIMPDGEFILILVAATIHLIVSSIIVSNLLDSEGSRYNDKSFNQPVVEKAKEWQKYVLGSYLMLFVSVIIEIIIIG